MKLELLDDVCVPYRADIHDAGCDLRARESGSIIPGKRILIPCGIKIALEPGTVGLIKPRSGLAVKHGIDIMAGVIDSNYRGEIHALIVNHGWEPFAWNKGDRIAQLLVLQYPMYGDFSFVDSIDTDTARGEAGFGSSGLT